MRLDDFACLSATRGPLATVLVLVAVAGCSPEDSAGQPAKGPGGAGSGGMPTGTGADTGMGASTGAGAAASGPGDAATGEDCAPPNDDSTAALCLHFEPEPLTLETTSDLDGRGILMIQLVERSTAALLQDAVIPEQPDPSAPVETSIYELPTLRFDGLPSEVDVIVVFVDNPLALATPEPVWGTWLAGSLDDPTSTEALRLTLTPGEARRFTVPLTALRLLKVRVTLGAGLSPLDDGQGPLLGALYDGPDLSTAQLMGQGGLPCADLVGGGAVELGITALGEGPHFVGVALNDFNVGSEPFPGSIWNASTSGTGVELQEVTTFGQTEYSKTFTTELVRIEPVDPSAPPPGFACPQPP